MPEMSTFNGSREARARSLLAVAHRRKNPTEIEAARRAHAEAKIEAFVEKTLAAAPPLTDEQRTRLAELLVSVRAAS